MTAADAGRVSDADRAQARELVRKAVWMGHPDELADAIAAALAAERARAALAAMQGPDAAAELATLRRYVQDTMPRFGAWCVENLLDEGESR